MRACDVRGSKVTVKKRNKDQLMWVGNPATCWGGVFRNKTRSLAFVSHVTRHAVLCYKPGLCREVKWAFVKLCSVIVGVKSPFIEEECDVAVTSVKSV